MATDPVTGVTVDEYTSEFSTNLGAALREIARFEPSLDVPYLSVYLDWRPEGERPQRRAAKTIFDHQVVKLRDQHKEHSTAWKSLEQDIERIEDFLTEELEPSVQGVMIIANSARDVFETFVLALPLDTRITTSPTPDLLPMTRIVEDYPRYAVLLADQHDATLTVINRADRRQRVSIQGSEMPRDHKQGGWSQRRFQTRAEERRAHFARAVADETRRALQDGDIEMLVLAGGEVMTNALKAEFHQEVEERLIGEIALDIKASRSEIIKASMPVVEQAERQREFVAVQALKDAAGAGGRGVLGVEKTLRALERGQVMMLLLASDFHQEGWADYTLNLYGAGPIPDEHPAGGERANLHQVDIAEELVRLTVVTDATGEIVHSSGAASTAFGDHKVGAILRFAAE